MSNPIYKEDLFNLVNSFRQASQPGTVEDGQLIRIVYDKIAGPDSRSEKAKVVAKEEAKRAKDIGMPLNSYTGRVSRVWTSKDGDLILNMFVLLERKGKYRSFNLTCGAVSDIESLEA